MYFTNAIFTTHINKPIGHKPSFGLCSLLDCLPDLLKIFPRNFEISTNNGKYYFNKDLICIMIPIIGGALNNDLSQFLLKIEDNTNIMKKIESLCRGDKVDFYKHEEKEIKIITKLFINDILSITYSNSNDDQLTKPQEKTSLKIDFKCLFQLLQEKLQKTFKIKTDKNEYACNSLGVMSSKAILAFLESNTNSDEFYFNFSDENSEFQLIADYFNFNEMKITSDFIDSLQEIAEQLEITPVISLINETYDKYDENLQKSTENQKIIEPYDELFERLFKIKETGPEEVSEFILKSNWIGSESKVEELVACLLHVINVDIFVHQEILDLIILLAERQDEIKELSILIPFLTNKIIKSFCKSKIVPSFAYKLYQKDFISIDTIIKQISFNLANKMKYLITPDYDEFTPNYQIILASLVWFFPELVERNLLNNKLLSCVLKRVPYANSNIVDNVEKMKELRDNYVETDSIIRALRNDDIDSFQTIITNGGIDIQNLKIEVPVFDNLDGKVSFIDYAAACGSIKCFKYLYLNNASFTKDTLIYSVGGGNVEIIRIVDQNKDNIVFQPTKKFYSSQLFNMNNNPKIDVFREAIKKHENDIFDWLLDQNSFESEKDLITLFKISISSGNTYAMMEILRKFSNLNKLENEEIYKIIQEACSNGFYSILVFLTQLIQFSDLVDPTKGEHSDLKDVSNRRIKIRVLNSDLLKSSISYGMFSIFELILKETGINNSQCLFNGLIEAAETNNLDVVKYILENKLYELSPLFLIKLIKQSIQAGSEDVTNYFFEKEVIVTNEILQSACSAQNINLVKLLIQKAAEKHISLDFTNPFIKAVNPFLDDICRHLAEMKVSLNYQIILRELNYIAEVNPRILILLIENSDDDFKDDIFTESLQAAINAKDTEIIDYLIKKGVNLHSLLLQAIKESDLTTVRAILEYNHTPEFINQIGAQGTPLHAAVRWDKKDIVELLLQTQGIDPSISIDSVKTPLIEAVSLNNLESVNLILDFYGESIKNQGYQIHNAFKAILAKQSTRNYNMPDIDVNMNNRMMFGFNNFDTTNERLIFVRLLDIKKDLEPINMIEEDLLSYAIIEKDESIVEKLLTMKTTDLKRKLKNRDSYLHIAIDGSEITPIQKLLIGHPDIDINSQNVLSETPLTKAVINENIELVELIVSHPEFDPILSRLDHAFFLSIPHKNLSRFLLTVNSLDVNCHSVGSQNQQFKRTPLMEAIKCNDIELAELIINHHSFDPSKSKIKSCLFNSVISKNLNLFRFLLKMNGNEVNIKNAENISLLGCAASIRNNEEILNEILSNDNFDPVKSDITASFLNSNNQKTMKMLVSYDEEHGNHLSLDSIDLNLQSDPTLDKRKQKLNKAHQYLLRMKEIVPKIHPFCTSIVSNQNKLTQDLYNCKTCEIEGICEICAKICHKNHEIEKVMHFSLSNKTSRCKCSSNDHQCKCMTSQICSDDDEIYDDMTINEKSDVEHVTHVGNYSNILRNMFMNHNNNILPKYKEEEEDNEEEHVNTDLMINHEFDSLKCSLDLSGFQPIYQIMYRCKKCQVDICQSCAIRCHKGHPLQYKGMVHDSLCNCKNVTDCKCTERKNAICSYLFYGTEYVVQPWFRCETCGTAGSKGCCALCATRCHHGHKVHSEREENAFCDCGSSDLKSMCQNMKFPPFNYLTCCTNRNQNYVIQKQRMYHCFTCGITSKNQGICESCALHCHIGHKVTFVGTFSFACECATMDFYCRRFNCIASLCPEMKNSGKCKRLNVNKNAIFGKFICYTCDREGQKEFCEACAVTCHKNHDVHFVEFSNFECQCEHCQCMPNGEQNESI